VLLHGHRGAPPGDVDALSAAIVAGGRLASDFEDSIAELDINPLLATPSGGIALDALAVPA
jgi:ATP-grasp domain